MIIANVRDKALRKLLETASGKGVIEPVRVLDMATFIVAAESFEDLAKPPNYGFHALKGDRKGAFAMTVTRNWRLTFVKVDERTVGELDLEDYH